MQMNKRMEKNIAASNGSVVLNEYDRKTRTSYRTKKRNISFFNRPKGLLLLILCIMIGIASIGSNEVNGLINTVIAVIVATVVDFLLISHDHPPFYFPDGAIVSGMIIGMVLGSTVPYYQVVATVIIAILSKHYLKVKKKPIFNPAAFGLLFSALTFSSAESWWGSFTLLSVWSIGLMFIGGYLIIQKVNKFPQVFAFLGMFLSIFLLLAIFHFGAVVDVFRSPYINSTLFLAFFMLTDPPTSPAKDRDQVWHGMIAAVVSVGAYLLFGGLYFLLIGLLAANIWKAWKFTKRKK